MYKLTSFIKYKDLFWQLTYREIRARYNQSVLGYGWAVLVPVVNLLVLSLVFSFFIKIPTFGVPYPIFLFIGLIPWTFTANSLSASVGSIVGNGTLITKIKLPREVIPISAICAKMVDLLLTSIVLVIFLFFFQINIYWTVLFVPVIFLVQLLLIIGVSLILSALNVFFRDIENALGVLLLIWMYLTPVLYPQDLVPENLRLLINLNPMTGIINSYRDTILYGRFPDWGLFGYSTVISMIILLFGLSYFRNKSKYFADVI